jgi:protein SCO1/2
MNGIRTRVSRLLSMLVAGLCVGLMACSSPPKQSEAQTPASAPPQQTQAQRFDLKGKVVSIDKAGKRLTVDHEAIPGFMGAMTMAYPVKDERLLDNLAPGDPVTAKVVSTGSEFWLENVATANQATPAK